MSCEPSTQYEQLGGGGGGGGGGRSNLVDTITFMKGWWLYFIRMLSANQTYPYV